MSNVSWLTLLGFYTLLIVGGIHYYENKIKDISLAIEDYKRALNISKGGEGHYAYLQLENHKLKQDIQYLSDANDHLQAENKSLRIDNQDLKAGTYGQYKGYSVGPVNMPAYGVKDGKMVSMGGNQDIQYESHTYKSKTWDYVDYIQDELDLEQ
jgi:hypothetical protein